MMKNILIPVDFSEVSWNAVYCAICHFKDDTIQFYIAHIESPPTTSEENGSLVIHKNIANHKKLQQWVTKATKLATPKQQIIPLEKTGHFIHTLRDIVKNYTINLIVIGTQQSNVFEDTLVGSYTREIITRIKQPVLIVPQEVPCPTPKQIALITDFNFKHNRKALQLISEITSVRNAHLSILNLIKQEGFINENQAENKKSLQENFANLDHSFHFVVNQTMDEALQFFINVQNVDLIILFAKNMNFSEHLLYSPSTDATISYHKHIPFLIVHE
ncbi:universal stress protein [uncultured Dokdonia sp.]|uniref:universal stress protein n=1 Tax=uncultured Dokdonia sp. TaxID=575653 RepID=UPI00260AA74E|nr:universal stress protein [uncultured Dokdonia sp.]